jgi:hypothetical protein
MKQFKIIDFWVSVGLIVSSILVWLINLFTDNEPFIIIYCYLIVGFWHVISMLTHANTRTNITKQGTRHIYHWISFVALITIPLGSFWFLTILAGPMAIFYTSLCGYEILSTKKLNYETV